MFDHTTPKFFDKREQRKGKYNKNGKTCAVTAFLSSSPLRGAAVNGMRHLFQPSLETFSSLTVPSAVNRSTERTYVSWKWSPGEQKWICFLNWTLLQACPSMFAAARVKVSEKIIHCLLFVCKNMALNTTDGQLSVTSNILSIHCLQPQKWPGMAH